MAMWKIALAAAAGAVAAYLFDPNSGRGRRARLSDQAKARGRRTMQEVEKRTRYEAGRAQGLLHEMRAGVDYPADDAELLQKVRSEAVGPSPIGTSDIEIHVDDGEVVLRGTARDPDAVGDLVDRIRDVAGVRAVRNELTPS